MSELYQHGTLGGLMFGLMDGTETVRNVLKHGDLGLGTLAGANGEIIVLDGTAFHAAETGEVTELTGEETTPYSAVVPFESQKHFELTDLTEKAVGEKILANLSHNLFGAVKIHGDFGYMHVRMAPKQTKPYPRFAEIAKHQPEFETKNVSGTIVGFYTPKIYQGVSAAGFHLHFISDDRTFGGHVLGYDLKTAKLELMAINDFHQHLPLDNQDFLEKEVELAGIAEDIEAAE